MKAKIDKLLMTPYVTESAVGIIFLIVFAVSKLQ